MGVSSSNNSQKSASSVSRIESVTVPAKSTVATGSTVVKSGTSSLTTPSTEKKDLKSERKTGAASTKASSKSYVGIDVLDFFPGMLAADTNNYI